VKSDHSNPNSPKPKKFIMPKHKGPQGDHNKLSFEAKIAKRQRDEEKGRIEPRQVAEVAEGGYYGIPHRMSRKDYMQKVRG